MNRIIFGFSLLLCLSASISDSARGQAPATEPVELVKTRAAYQQQIKIATDPIKLKYAEYLEGLKKTYGAKGDVDAALAIQKEIDKEITLVALPPKSSAVKTATDLQRYLGDTTWTWGTSEKSVTSILTFGKDGSCSVNKDAPVRWAAVDDSTIKLENGTIIKFTNNRKSYTATTASGIRAGKKQ